MEKVEIRELVEEALESIISKKKIDIGLVKLEIKTDGDSISAIGSKSGLYEDIKSDLTSNQQIELDIALEKLQDELIKFQELFATYIEE